MVSHAERFSSCPGVLFAATERATNGFAVHDGNWHTSRATRAQAGAFKTQPFLRAGSQTRSAMMIGLPQYDRPDLMGTECARDRVVGFVSLERFVVALIGKVIDGSWSDGAGHRIDQHAADRPTRPLRGDP